MKYANYTIGAKYDEESVLSAVDFVTLSFKSVFLRTVSCVISVCSILNMKSMDIVLNETVCCDIIKG